MYSVRGNLGNHAVGHPRARAGCPAHATRGAPYGLAAALSAVLLAACASEAPKSSGTEESAPADGQNAGVQAGDAVARFTAPASPGASSRVNYEGRTLYVTVGTFYQSAAGNRCRRVTIRSAEQGSYATGVCREDGVWQTVMVY